MMFNIISGIAIFACVRVILLVGYVSVMDERIDALEREIEKLRGDNGIL